jgi:hypothetical protein
MGGAVRRESNLANEQMRMNYQKNTDRILVSGCPALFPYFFNRREWNIKFVVVVVKFFAVKILYLNMSK